MRRFLPFGLVLFTLISAGCGRNRGPQRPPIGQAYAGPAALKLRQDIPLGSPVVATLKHGEKLDIVQRRRRFLRVRTPGGVEGWTEENVLLSADEMAALRELVEQARRMPSHGVAITFDLLNVHTLPERRSPSYFQVNQKDRIEVLAYLVAPRASPRRKPLIPPAPKKAKTAKKPKEPRYPPPPMPAPPRPPPNWLDLSKTNLPPQPVEPPKPVPSDDWALVRTANGMAGWVLSRRLFMNIPNEVAQYAEGHRITSYFSLGEVRDGDQVKHNWLWTTLSGSLQEHDFDSFRVFIWNLRRHRYETAYIERKLKGHFPVLVNSVEYPTGAATTHYPGFSICVEKEDGRFLRRKFAFIVNVVRSAGEEPCAAPAPGQPATSIASAGAPTPEPPKPSLFARVKKWFRGLRGK